MAVRWVEHKKTGGPTMTDGRLRASTLQSLILTGKRHHEIPRLRVVGMAHGKSDKSDSQPLTEKSRRDHGSLAPGRDFHQRKGFPQFQGKQLRQGIGRRANLHPQFQWSSQGFVDSL